MTILPSALVPSIVGYIVLDGDKGGLNRAMAQLRDQKNEVRRKYRAALRNNQPKETIVNWLVLTIAWLGSITESGDRKNHSTCSPECRKIENHCATNILEVCG